MRLHRRRRDFPASDAVRPVKESAIELHSQILHMIVLRVTRRLLHARATNEEPGGQGARLRQALLGPTARSAPFEATELLPYSVCLCGWGVRLILAGVVTRTGRSAGEQLFCIQSEYQDGIWALSLDAIGKAALPLSPSSVPTRAGRFWTASSCHVWGTPLVRLLALFEL